jgi:hypothetical protein
MAAAAVNKGSVSILSILIILTILNLTDTLWRGLRYLADIGIEVLRGQV